jgi:hypothetical protein
MKRMSNTIRMSRRAARVMAAVLVMSAAGVSIASAQTRVVAKVPFDFIVGETVMPAGDYLVQSVVDETGVMSVESDDGRFAAVTLAQPATSLEPFTTPHLVFDKFGGRYFLARVVASAGDEQEILLTPAKMEKEIAVINAER